MREGCWLSALQADWLDALSDEQRGLSVIRIIILSSTHVDASSCESRTPGSMLEAWEVQGRDVNLFVLLTFTCGSSRTCKVFA